MKTCDFEERAARTHGKERERERTKAGDQTGNKETTEERRTKKERMILAAGVWRNERKREVEEDLEGGRERERKERIRKKGAANWPPPAGGPGATGSPLRPKTLLPSSLVSRLSLQPPLVPSLSLLLSSPSLSRFFFAFPARPPVPRSLPDDLARSTRSETNERHPSASPVRQFVRNFWLEANRETRASGRGRKKENEGRLFTAGPGDPTTTMTTTIPRLNAPTEHLRDKGRLHNVYFYPPR